MVKNSIFTSHLGEPRRSRAPALWRAVVALLALIGALTIGRDAGAVGSAGEKRVALVIGIGSYKAVPALKNPVPDAQAISAMLKSLGFDVVEGYDTDLTSTRKLLQEFRQKMEGTKAAVFFFAGHGIAINNENYILPVDAKLQSEADVDFNAVPLRFVVRQMEQESKVNIVLLDACRDNPFEEQLKRSLGTRSSGITRGLASLEKGAQGRLISFATMPGNVAFDGEANSNSPFTTALLRHMAAPGVPVSVVMDKVREDVHKATNEKQLPYLESGLIGTFYFNPPKPEQVAALPANAAPVAGGNPSAVSPPPPAGASGLNRGVDQVEVAFWDSVQKANSLDEYKAYLAAYPTGAFSALAQSRISKLQDAAAGKPVRIIGDTSVAGTATTEKTLKLKPEAVREIHDRLRLVNFDPGASATKFGPKARAAITDWQKSRAFPDTGFFTQAHYNALLEATDDQFERWKNTAALQPSRAVAPGTKPVSRTIAAEQRRRQRAPEAGQEFDVAGEPPPQRQRRAPAPAQDNGAGNALGAAILGGVIGGAIGGGLRRGW